MPQGPLFLARAVYRRRRLRDAARLLPIIGLLAVFLPALGEDSSNGHASTAIYLFALWAVMIALAAAIAPHLMRADAEGADEPTDTIPAEAGDPLAEKDEMGVANKGRR